MKLQIRIWGNVLTAVRLRGLVERKLRERQPQSQGRMKATQNPSQGGRPGLTKGRGACGEHMGRNKGWNLMKYLNTTIQEVQHTPDGMNSKTPRL